MAISTPASPAHGCTLAPPPHVDDVLPGEPIHGEDAVLGVYEYEHVARSPDLLVTVSQSVSVVTRYWGTPPPRTGLQRHGGSWELFFGGDRCGVVLGSVGDVGYGWVDESTANHPERSRSSLSIGGIDGGLTADQEAMLTERFGSAVVNGVSLRDRVVGSLMAWQWHLMAFVVTALVLIGVLRWRRKLASRRTPVADDQASTA